MKPQLFYAMLTKRYRVQTIGDVDIHNTTFNEGILTPVLQIFLTVKR